MNGTVTQWHCGTSGSLGYDLRHISRLFIECLLNLAVKILLFMTFKYTAKSGYTGCCLKIFLIDLNFKMYFIGAIQHIGAIQIWLMQS